ncbi:hypothetical protein ACFLSS_03295 [Bacteroidota bacterium]
MIRQLRRKFASSISLIEHEEDFLYDNWLRNPGTNSLSIGAISSTLFDTSFITFGLKQPFSIAHFFLLGDTALYPEDVSYLFGKTGTNPVFFQLLYVPSRIINHHNIDPELSEDSYREIDIVLVKPAESEISVQFKTKKPQGYLFRLSEPDIEDHLNNLKPKVIKFDLLNQNDFSSNGDQTLVKEINVNNFGEQKIENYNVDTLPGKPKLFKVKVPGMGKYKSKIYSLKLSAPVPPKVSKYKALKPIEFSEPTSNCNLNFDQTETQSPLIEYSFDIDSTIKKDYYNDDNGWNNEIGQLLKRSFKVEWQSHNNSIISLSKSEEENAKFLAENNRAFLAEEPGLDAKKEVLAAMQFLYSGRIITNTLIITPAFNIGYRIEDCQLGTTSGWLGKIEKYFPDMAVTCVRGNDEARLSAWKDSSHIHIADHRTFIKDINLFSTATNGLNRFDCIIIDEVQEILINEEILNDQIKNINPQVFWMLSSRLNGELPARLSTVFNEIDLVDQLKFIRLPDRVKEGIEINHEEFWLQPDEPQKVEYKETLKECRKELRRILESGNPLHYQANIFILLHKLFQVQNFATDKLSSPKLELLRHQVESIKQNGRQVIIVSQYDQQGIKKIERLFDDADISYVSVSSGYSAEQLKKSVSLFKTKKDVTVFLTNDKVQRLNFGNYFVPYVIRFDSWWNPGLVANSANLFDFEEKTHARSMLNIFSYKMLDTIDEQIKQILLSKNLIDNNILTAMPTNKLNDLISVDEWVKIFGLLIEDDEDRYKQLYNDTYERLRGYSFEDMKDSLSRFFAAIGYADFEIASNENSKIIDITGEGKSGGKIINLSSRLYREKDIDKETVQEMLSKSRGPVKCISFLITGGTVSDECYSTSNKDLVLMDIKQLVKYMIQLNIVNAPIEQPV